MIELNKYKTHSYDVFSTLKDALSPDNFDSPIFPDDFFVEWEENIIFPREVRVYKIVKFLSSNIK